MANIKKQRRGCSQLYYAIATDSDTGTTYETPKKLAIVKSVSRTIDGASEEVWGDNELVDEVYAGYKVTRSFEVVRVDGEVEAELMGDEVLTVGGNKIFATNPNGNNKPYIAVGYALHDGDEDNPCELVWAGRGKVSSISKSASTIDGGTGSEGQTVEIVFVAPRAKYSKTGKRNPDITIELDTTKDNSEVVEKWFKQVVTPDNAETVLGK